MGKVHRNCLSLPRCKATALFFFFLIEPSVQTASEEGWPSRGIRITWSKRVLSPTPANASLASTFRTTVHPLTMTTSRPALALVQRRPGRVRRTGQLFQLGPLIGKGVQPTHKPRSHFYWTTDSLGRAKVGKMEQRPAVGHKPLGANHLSISKSMPELPIKTAKTLNNMCINPPTRVKTPDKPHQGNDGKHFSKSKETSQSSVPAAVEQDQVLQQLSEAESTSSKPHDGTMMRTP